MNQKHLQFQDQVNLGSYYTPPEIVNLAWQMIKPSLDSQTTLIDTACGYGDFLKNHQQSMGYDIDGTAISIAKKNNDKTQFFQTNTLHKVSRGKFGISSEAKLIAVGNPPYNDKTSLIRREIKSESFDIDADLASRDLGISFLRSYDKLQADWVCVLHPLSYLIKPTNFKSLKGFAANYRLVTGHLISSSTFKESAKLTPFPIVVALYQRDRSGMDYDFIRAFRFDVHGGGCFCLSDFDYITNYIRKYPSKRQQPIPDDSALFWTMRDINALKRNRTFVKNYSNNTIVIEKRKLGHYAYVDVFKRNLYRLPFYFGNCDVPIDDKLFRQSEHYFINDTIRHHPFLEKHFQIDQIEKERVDSKLDTYFRLLLGKHHAKRGTLGTDVPDELEAAFDACPAVYFTYGLCEPHGPQNTVGLDALKAHAIACRAAQTHGGIVAPPDYWHIHEHGMYANWAYRSVGEVRSWLTAMPAWQHFKNICYHVRAADALGFHAAIFLTGHYGPNWQDLKTLLSLIQPHFAMRLYGLPDFEANTPGFDRQGNGGDHAGRVETSLLWALEPDCVDMSRLPETDAGSPHFAMGANALESDRRIGERMVNDEVAWLGTEDAGTFRCLRRSGYS